MKFAQVKAVRLPNGFTREIRHNDKKLWGWQPSIRYVSLGDSIAAGCNIEPKSGYSVISGEYNSDNVHPLSAAASALIGREIPNNKRTVIVDDSYTDLIKRHLESSKYGEGYVETTSFAMSGCTNEKLVEIIQKPELIAETSRADLVTISIGANSILTEIFTYLLDYFIKGDITGFEHVIYKNLQLLAGKAKDYYDSNGNLCSYPGVDFTQSTQSYKYILDILTKRNSKAKYIFTEVYNPYKYLHISKGEDGFFGTFSKMFPDLYIDVDLIAKVAANVDVNTGLKFRFDNVVKEALVGEYSPINIILDNVNNLCNKVEIYVNELNSVLRTSVENYCKDNNVSNVFLADSKNVFDTIPDKPFASTGERYNVDAVSCAYSAGFDYIKDTQWERIWEGYNSSTEFWFNYIFLTKKNPGDSDWAEEKKYVTYDFPDNLADWFNITSYMQLVKEIHWDVLIPDICIDLLLKKIIIQDIDPHPRAAGHQALYRSFADVIRRAECLDIPNMESLARYNITYDANGGSGTETRQVVGLKDSVFVRLTPPDPTPPTDYCLTGWSLDKNNLIPNYKDAEGELKYYYLNSITSDCTVYATWAKAVNLTYYKLCTLSDAHKLGLAAAGKSISNETGPITKMPGIPYYLRFNLIYPNGTTEHILVEEKFSETASGYDGSSPHINRKIPDTARIEIGLVNKGSGDKCELYADNVQKAKGKYILSSTENYKYNPNGELLPDLNVCFVWHTEGDYFDVTGPMQSYWKCWIQDMTPHYKTVTFDSNNGTGKTSQQTLSGWGSLPATGNLKANTFVHPITGYRFMSWNTKADGTGTSYTNGNAMSIKSNITLYAQWSNQYIIRHKHTKCTDWVESFTVMGVNINTNPNKYQLWVDGTYVNQIATDSEDVFSVPYGTPLGVVVGSIDGATPTFVDATSSIYLDNKLVASKKKDDANYDLVNGVTSDLIIDFQWHTSNVQFDANAENKTSYEECHITAFDASYQPLVEPYKVTFNANGGTGSMNTQKVLQWGNWSARILPKCDAFSYAAGYHFAGWNTKTDGSGNSYSSGKSIPITSDVTLFAQWAKNIHTLTIIQANKSAATIESTDYNHRNLYVNSSTPTALATGWNNQKTETISVAYDTPIQLSIQGRASSDDAPKPNCTIHQHNGSDYVGLQTGKLVTADFNMPDEDVTIEYWFNRNVGSSYSHRWWDAYIRNKNLDVDYSASNN